MKKHLFFLLFSLLPALVFGQLRGAYKHNSRTIFFQKDNHFYCYDSDSNIGEGEFGKGKYRRDSGLLILEFEDCEVAPKITKDKITTTEAAGDSITLHFTTNMYYGKQERANGYLSVCVGKNKKEAENMIVAYHSDTLGWLCITLPKTKDSIYLHIFAHQLPVYDKEFVIYTDKNYALDLNFYIGPYLLKKGDIYRYNIRQIRPKSIALKRKGYGKSSFLHYKKYEKKKEQESEE
jgi:hypothetical protein